MLCLELRGNLRHNNFNTQEPVSLEGMLGSFSAVFYIEAFLLTTHFEEDGCKYCLVFEKKKIITPLQVS